MHTRTPLQLAARLMQTANTSAPAPANMRLQIRYQLSTINSSMSTLIKTVIMPLASKTIEKYMMVKVPEADNLVVSDYWLTRKCVFATVDQDTIKGGPPDAAASSADALQHAARGGVFRFPGARMPIAHPVNSLTGSGVGYPVDYYLYVTDDTNSTFCYGMISAIGATCQLGGTVNRPILGTINLCPRSFSLLLPDMACWAGWRGLVGGAGGTGTCAE